MTANQKRNEAARLEKLAKALRAEARELDKNASAKRRAKKAKKAPAKKKARKVTRVHRASVRKSRLNGSGLSLH